MDTVTAIHTRRSIRDYDKRPVARRTVGARARLGSCWVGAPVPWLRSRETRRELSIPDGFEPFAAFTLGYAATLPPPRSRERPEIVWA